MKLDLEANVSETTRLLADGAKAVDPTKMLDDLPDPLKILSNTTITTYEAEDLTGWGAVTIYAGSIFTQKAVLRIMLLQICTCWGIAYLLSYFTRHPENYRTDAVQEIIKTITISIAFLLGLFLNQCVARWWDTVKAIEGVAGSMKKVLMTAISLRLPKQTRERMARCMVLSLRVLEAEIEFALKECSQRTAGLGPLGSAEDLVLETFWEDRFSEFKANGWVTGEELELLQTAPPKQRAQLCWQILSDEIARNRPNITAGGVSDVVASDRFLAITQQGVSRLSDLETLQTFQLPFIYVHMLAFMVHFVNMLTAAGTGVSVGLMLAQSRAMNKPLDMSQVGSYMVFVLVQAFLYQAFLSIGTALSFPIAGSAYNIPLRQKAELVEEQLALMNRLARD